MISHLDRSVLAGVSPHMQAHYRSAQPFPHGAYDGLIDPEAITAAMEVFPGPDAPGWTHYVHFNERKHANTRLDSWPEPLQVLATELMSPEFVGFLEQLTGIDGLLADPEMDGGGLHMTEPGGHLNIHADYTKHHTHPDWQRRVNVLLYLNAEWDPEWGGALELWSTDMSTRVTAITPAANRMAIFTTTSTSYHGHPEPLRSPAGVPRRSLALYYFTAGSHEPARTTHYRSRPTDGWRKVLIYLDGKALRAYDLIKRRTGFSDKAVSRILGVMNRRRRGPSRG